MALQGFGLDEEEWLRNGWRSLGSRDDVFFLNPEKAKSPRLAKQSTKLKNLRGFCGLRRLGEQVLGLPSSSSGPLGALRV